MRKVVVFSDCIDIAYNEIYEILSNGFEEHNLTDIQIAPLVALQPFSIVQTAFSLRLMAELCKPGTLFLVIMYGSGQNPQRIFGQTRHGILFVGRNAGYFNWMLEDFGLQSLYVTRLDEKVPKRTFGGKYIQAPTTVQLLASESLEDIGDRVDPSFLMPYEIPKGTVVHVDNFGLMKMKSSPIVYPEGTPLRIYVNGTYKFDAIFTEKMKRQPDGTWVIYPGSSLNHLPELGRVRSRHSASEIGVVEGDVIAWETK